MSVLYIVVDDVADWKPFYPSENVIGFEEYLRLNVEAGRPRTRVINLCRTQKYLSRGYYCSLLAEARGQAVIPSVETLNNLRNRQLYALQVEDIESKIAEAAGKAGAASFSEFSVLSYFGRVQDPALRGLTRDLFERFPCPIMRIQFRRQKQWQIAGLTPLPASGLNDDQQTEFAEALEAYSHRVWRKPKQRKRYRYDLAILVNPDEKLPPSDPAAIRRFVRAGRNQGLAVELIRRRDYSRLEEYDALFIRETTAIDHHTYRFAKKAQAAGMVVIDDPTSILRCTNKVYLADLMLQHKVPAPGTRLMLRGANEDVLAGQARELGYPLVLKIPDGSFSRGVIKVASEAELPAGLQQLFRNSAILLAQEYLYTDFDWRIGVLNGQAIYACKYYMVRDHWQIYRHSPRKTDSGGFATVVLQDVPGDVIAAAVRVCSLIGDGMYGVDLKQSGDRLAVIEVNDNPSIDYGVEDLEHGDALYGRIMGEFLRRIEDSRRPGVL